MRKRAFILCVVTFLVLMSILFYVEFGPLASASTEHERTTQTSSALDAEANSSGNKIRRAIEKYYEIARTKDRAALRDYSFSLTTPDYRYSSERGVMNREEAFRVFDSTRVKFLSAGFEDLEVEVLGDVAIAKYVDNSIVRKGGEMARTPVRFTSVWVERDGEWRIIAEHSSVLTSATLPPFHPFVNNMAWKPISGRF